MKVHKLKKLNVSNEFDFKNYAIIGYSSVKILINEITVSVVRKEQV